MYVCQLHAAHCTAPRGVAIGRQPPRYNNRTRCVVCVQSATKQNAIAATLLSALLAASPDASAALGSSDYINVQERSRQRAPLQQPSPDRSANSDGPSNSSPYTRLSIPQQACCLMSSITY